MVFLVFGPSLLHVSDVYMVPSPGMVCSSSHSSMLLLSLDYYSRPPLLGSILEYIAQSNGLLL